MKYYQSIMSDVFDFSDYRLFLGAQIEANKSIRGYQSRLAEAADCKRSFLSQVLHSHVNLTPDHAAGLCRFWNFNDDETDWYIELLANTRAGSAEMRKVCSRRLNELKKRRANLSDRFKPSRILPKESQIQYYSNWYCAAIHMLTCIPGYNSLTKIANRLNLREGLVRESLQLLEQTGLVKNKQGTWRATDKDIHLPKMSNLNLINHINWRQRAIFNIQLNDEDSLHYTAVHALSKGDIEKIQELMVAAIKKTRDVVVPSPEEELVCVICDVFRP
jgi:uncharacterized protein (TIGR02147 family)